MSRASPLIVPCPRKRSAFIGTRRMRERASGRRRDMVYGERLQDGEDEPRGETAGLGR